MKKIVIASGKGGVGKTSITIAVAEELRDRGFKVGILDVDIDTPNVPLFMDIKEEYIIDDKIKPVNKNGIEVASIGIMIEDNTCVMWNGTRRTMAIDQFINEVEWTCDVMIIDTPPGTTEEIASVIRKLDVDGVVIVTTPHPASIMDIKRTVTMLNLYHVSIIGIINNMYSIRCKDCGSEQPIFGEFPDISKDPTLGSIEIIGRIPYTSNVQSEDELKKAVDFIEEVL